MNQKKSVLLSGTLMYPLVVGGIAMIYHQGQFIRASRIVAIRKRTARKICFETMNTNYTLLLDPSPQAVTQPQMLSMAA